jgi:hypothetical protein
MRLTVKLSAVGRCANSAPEGVASGIVFLLDRPSTGCAMGATVVFSELPNVVEIDWYDESDEIVVTPKNQLRFTIQKDRAIEALRIVKDAERFTLQFDLLLGKLGRWVKERTRDIQTAIITLQDNSLMFIVVQAENRYDEQLQDDLAELDFAVAQDTDLDLVRLRTVMLPPVDSDALGSFVDTRMVLQYQHGK